MSTGPHFGPVPAGAWEADAEARARGRVEMFNATRPGGQRLRLAGRLTAVGLPLAFGG